MKEEIKAPALIAVAVVVLAVVIWFGYKSVSNSGNLDQGQIKYTPGVPPWKETDPSKKGPVNTGAPMPDGGPPGMPATTVGGN